jgi:hypothetical protein
VISRHRTPHRQFPPIISTLLYKVAHEEHKEVTKDGLNSFSFHLRHRAHSPFTFQLSAYNSHWFLFQLTATSRDSGDSCLVSNNVHLEQGDGYR